MDREALYLDGLRLATLPNVTVYEIDSEDGVASIRFRFRVESGEPPVLVQVFLDEENEDRPLMAFSQRRRAYVYGQRLIDILVEMFRDAIQAKRTSVQAAEATLKAMIKRADKS